MCVRACVRACVCVTIRKTCKLTNVLWYILHNIIGCQVKGFEEAAFVIRELMRSYTQLQHLFVNYITSF